MPVDANSEGFDRVRKKFDTFFDGMAKDLEFIGEGAATEIVRTTLAGIGEGDQPFTPYSESYKQTLDAVGGKPQGTVSLRGMFYKEGDAVKLPARRKGFAASQDRKLVGAGANRQSFLQVRLRYLQTFRDEEGIAHARMRERIVQFKTAATRPQLGLTDPLSEMSLDLITIETTNTSVKLIYTSRRNGYMLFHQEGKGKNPQRKWFTLAKAAVKASIMQRAKTVLAARVQRFNDASKDTVKT